MNRKPIARALIGVVAAIVGATLLWRVRVVLLPFIVAIALVYVLSPLVVYLERKGFERTRAIVAIYLVFVVVFGLAITTLLPVLIRELNGLGEAIPGLTREIQGFLDALHRGYARTQLPEAIRQVVDDSINGIEQQVLALTRGAVNGILALFSSLLLLVISPILAFYILRDLKAIKACVYRAFPRDSKNEWWNLMDSLDAVLNGFVRGQLLIAVLVGLMSALALVILGVRFAVILGLIAGVFDLVPYFGPVLGALPAVSLALLESPLLALKVTVAFVLIQQVESTILSPKIMGDRVGLHPVAVILAVLVGGHVLGFWGIVLAVPAAALAKVVLVAAWTLLKETSIYQETMGVDLEDEPRENPPE